MLLLFSDRISSRRKTAYVAASLIVVGIVLLSLGRVPDLNLLPWAFASLLSGASLGILFACPTRLLWFARNRFLNALLLALVVPVSLVLGGALALNATGLCAVEQATEWAAIGTPIAVLVAFIGSLVVAGEQPETDPDFPAPPG